MAERRSKVTMLDIARASGVSLSTVSLALNDKPGLPHETRQKVQNAARALGYIRVPVAGSNRSHPVSTIGVLVNSVEGNAHLPAENIFFSQVIAGIESACRAEEIALFYSTHSASSQSEVIQIPRLVQDPRVDGLLLLGNTVDDRLLEAVRVRSMPIVLVEAYGSSGEYDSIEVDNSTGATQAVSYLIEQGHQHIAFLGGLSNSGGSYQVRRQGYQQALRAHGISTPYYADCHPNNRNEIIIATCKLLEEQPQVRAIFACSDEVALVAMHAIMDFGKRVPDDISVIGFGNDLTAENATPSLTTIHVDKTGMGRLAVQQLINRVENPLLGYITTQMHTRLVERQSVHKVALPVTL